MADFGAPSFSLGLDFDLTDLDPHITADKDLPSSSRQFSPAVSIPEDDVDFETLVVGDSETEDPLPPPKLKRLRRGPAVDATPSSVSAKTKVELPYSVVDDDDIEEFSSQEDRRTDEQLSAKNHSIGSSSKIPLNGHGVLTKQSGKRKQDVSSAPESVITTCNNWVFPKLTVSPLRRIQLIDSDSDFDDPYVVEGATDRKCNDSESYFNQNQFSFPQHASSSEQKKVNESISTLATEDLWEDFHPVKTFPIQTPVFDEVCKEYFRSMKDTNKSQCKTGLCSPSSHGTERVNQQISFGDSLAPAHRYFFHDDPKIRKLVRTRLPNFFPLGGMNNRDFEQPSTSNIDYMGQFSHGESSKQAKIDNKAEKGSCSRKNSRKSNAEETSQGWVDPKRSTGKGIPKDAGKRRVHAVGQSAGRWLPGPGGTRVYVTKNGQELTGQAAYRQYRKESGAGFKKGKGKKKAATRKK